MAHENRATEYTVAVVNVLSQRATIADCSFIMPPYDCGRINGNIQLMERQK